MLQIEAKRGLEAHEAVGWKVGDDAKARIARLA